MSQKDTDLANAMMEVGARLVELDEGECAICDVQDAVRGVLNLDPPDDVLMKAHETQAALDKIASAANYFAAAGEKGPHADAVAHLNRTGNWPEGYMNGPVHGKCYLSFERYDKPGHEWKGYTLKASGSQRFIESVVNIVREYFEDMNRGGFFPDVKLSEAYETFPGGAYTARYGGDSYEQRHSFESTCFDREDVMNLLPALREEHPALEVPFGVPA